MLKMGHPPYTVSRPETGLLISSVYDSLIRFALHLLRVSATRERSLRSTPLVLRRCIKGPLLA